MENHEILLVLSSAVGGYLIGSVSFARLLAHLHPLRTSIEAVEVPVIAFKHKIMVPMRSVSATSLRYKLGAKWGISASLLDMLKALIPVLVLRSFFLDQPFYYIAAAALLVGHNWPVYHKFIGGYGVSIVYGSLIVIDWPGLLVSLAVAMVFYAVAARIKIGRNIALALGLLVLIPWAWYIHHDVFYLGYAVLFNIAYVVKLYPDAMTLRRLMKAE